MKIRVTSLLFAVSLISLALPAQASTGLPAACGTKSPVLAENEQLVERKLYFHGEETAGDLDGFNGFLGDTDGQTLSTTAPTSTTPKVDTNGSRSVYPATLPGNPIMSAWQTYIEDPQPWRIACYSFDFWAAGDGADMNVMVWPDSDFIVGTGARAETVATGTGDNVRRYTGKGRPSKPIEAGGQLYAQIEAAGPAAILYDSVDYPSSITLVMIEPKPVEPTPEPTPTPSP